ncbi:G patch domain-containing protein 11 [Borealophlyctis nickersoniae]|nr:G patch domain-containing protein 11 [Borealophlyctis nickersoniae]
MHPTTSPSATADDEEDDYMSSAFLTEAVEPPKTQTYSQRRKAKLVKQSEKAVVKPLKVREREARETGLATELPEDNKGFKMLAKLGFKKGMSLGASTASDARVEPLPIIMKSDRLGLGLSDPPDPVAKRHRSQKEEEDLEAAEAAKREEYRLLMNQRFTERQILSDLTKARKACEQMDEAAGLPRTEFWWSKEGEEDLNEDEGAGEYVMEGEEVLSEFEMMEPQKQLEQVTQYLRERHFYCIWCGAAYDDRDELQAQCPGNTADDHD